MAATTAGIGLGDAVLRVAVDLTDFNSGLDQVKAITASKLKPAGDTVNALAKAFDQAGAAAAAANQPIKSTATSTGTLAEAFKLLAPAVQKSDSELQNMAFALRNVQGAAIVTREAVYNLGGELLTAGGDVETLTGEMAVGAAGARELGEVMTLAGEEAKFSMYEARGEIGLIGEEIGVKLPRHVRSFLAELPGVGSALSAAFEATAVVFLVQALIEGANKLSDFIASTFIFTESMKAADLIVSKSNQDLVKYGDETTKLKEAFQLLGLQGVAKTGEQMRLLQKDIDANTKALDAAKTKVTELNASLQPNPNNIFLDDSGRAAALEQAQKDRAKEIAEANAGVLVTQAILKENQQKLTNLVKEGGVERLAELRKAALAEIEIDKEQANSVAALKRDENKQLAAEANSGIAVLTQIDAKYQLEIYNNELAALQRKAQLDRTDPSKDPNLVKKDLAAIEKLQRDHAAALIKIYADTIQGINSLSLADTGHGIVDHLLGTDFKDKFAEFEADAKTLGIVTNSDLKTSLEDAAAAYTRLKDSGKATYDELLHALLKVQQAQLAFDRDLGNTVAAKQDQQAVDNLNRSIAALEGREEKFTSSIRRQSPVLKAWQQELDQTGKKSMALGAALGTGISIAMQAYAQGAITIEQALAKMVQAEIQAIASIAETRGSADLAKAFGDLGDYDFAAAANHFEGAALWFALAGVSSLGSAALSGNSSSGTSNTAAPSGTQASAPNPAQTPTQEPVSVVNTPRLARGAVVDKKTKVIVGDDERGGDATEAIIPLDDKRATDRIAAAIAKPLQYQPPQYQTGLLTARTVSAIGSTPATNGSHGQRQALAAEQDRRFDAMSEAIERIGEQRGGDVFNVHVDGVMSGDNLHKVFKKASQGVSKGKVRFTSGNSFRVTRRG